MARSSMRLNAELPKLKVPEPFYGLGLDAIHVERLAAAVSEAENALEEWY